MWALASLRSTHISEEFKEAMKMKKNNITNTQKRNCFCASMAVSEQSLKYLLLLTERYANAAQKQIGNRKPQPRLANC